MRTRIPLLYLILAVLLVISVVPVWWFGQQVVGISRDTLKTNEMLLQNTITRSLSDDLGQRVNNLRLMMQSLSTGVQVSSGGNLSGKSVEAPELRALLERFVTSQNGMVPYVTLLNEEPKGISAGSIPLDEFMRRELEHAFEAARDGRSYNGQALSMGGGKDARTVMLISTPIVAGDRTIGMIGVVVDLQFLIDRLRSASQGGLVTYVVDRQGRLVAAGAGAYATGQDMNNFEIVKNFVEQGGNSQFVATKEFETKWPQSVEMLGTYSPSADLGWTVVAQKTQTDAYHDASDIQHTAIMLAIAVVVVSMLISIFSARQITNPLEQLTESSRAIAKGDFTQRVQLKSKTEIGELASTFNSMSMDLERFVFDLNRAAEDNRPLSLSSIQMLAGAVDAKEPDTHGRSH